MPDGTLYTSIATTAEEVWDEIRPAILTRVVYEQFGGRLLSEHGLHTVRIIGGIQALCALHKIPVEGRTPQSRKGFVHEAEEYLRKNKLSDAGKRLSFMVHEVDALSHLMSYLKLGELSPNRKTTAKHYTRSRA